MTNHLKLLNFPATARIVEHDSEDGWLDCKQFLALADDLARGVGTTVCEHFACGLQADNSVETLALACGLLRRGLVPSLYPVGLNEDDRSACLQREGAARLFSDGEWRLLGDGTPQAPDYQLLMHSSGSTGVPKSLGIRLDAMRENALGVGRLLGLTSDDIHMGTMSQCYMSGFYNSFVLPLVLGAGTVSLPVVTPLRAKILLAALERHRPSVLWLSPLIAKFLATARGIPASALETLRFGLSCTASLPVATKEAFEDKFGLPLLASYGLCETLITTVEVPGTIGPSGSVGQPVGGPSAVSLGENDQILVSNGALLAGYVEDSGFVPLDTDVYNSGDTGVIHPDGNLSVTGRMDEVINRDGIKFSPAEVEAALLGVPGVEECVVVGVPDATLGTRVVAWYRGCSSAEEVSKGLHGRLKPVMTPHRLMQIADIPKTASGKPDRVSLKKKSVEL